MKFFVKWYEKHGYDFVTRVFAFVFLRRSDKKIEWLRRCGAQIGEGCIIRSPITGFPEPFMVEIGNNVYVATRCHFLTHDGAYSWITRKMGLTEKRTDKLGMIVIGDNCFIGEGVTITPNTTIGTNCIVGANALVGKNIGDNQVVGGNPAHTICSVEEYINKYSDLSDYTCGLPAGEKRKYFEAKRKNKKFDR